MHSVATELRRIIADITPQLRAIDDPDFATRPRPKKWSRKEVLGHLIDSACNNQQKFVRMMETPQLDFVGYHQDEWVDLQKWATADWHNMVQLWSSYNLHIAWLIESVEPTHLQHEVMIDGVGPFTLDFIMPDYVEHLKHHLNQIFPDLNFEHGFEDVYH